MAPTAHTISRILGSKFPALISANNKEYKGFQWEKATLKVSLLCA